MKILLGIHQFFPESRTGTEVLTLELARGLRRRGHSVNIVTCKEEPTKLAKEPPWITHYSYDDFPVHCLHFGSAENKDSVTPHIFSPARVQIIKDLVTQIKPDLVHFYHIKGFSASIIPELRGIGIPVFFTPTDFWVVCPKITLLRTFDRKICSGPGDAVMCVKCFKNVPESVARLGLKLGKTFLRYVITRIQLLYALGRRVKDMTNCVNYSNRILTETKFLSKILIEHGVSKRIVKTIPTGVDIGELPVKIYLPPIFSVKEPLRIGFIGSLHYNKGPQVLLNALSDLGEDIKKVRIDIYGKKNPSDFFCETLVKKSKSLSENIQFKGTFPHELMGQVLRSFHVLVIPSIWYESAPLVLCSALAAGTPVLISRLEGMTELLQEGVNGYSFLPGDSKALCDYFVRFLQNPELIRKIFENPHIRKRSTEDYVNEIESEYKSILN